MLDFQLDMVSNLCGLHLLNVLFLYSSWTLYSSLFFAAPHLWHGMSVCGFSQCLPCLPVLNPLSKDSSIAPTFSPFSDSDYKLQWPELLPKLLSPEQFCLKNSLLTNVTCMTLYTVEVESSAPPPPSACFLESLFMPLHKPFHSDFRLGQRIDKHIE